MAGALAAILVGSLAQGVTGFGMNLVALPILVYFVDPGAAVAVLVMANLPVNLLQTHMHRRAAEPWPAGIVVGAAGAVGVLGGTVLLDSLDARAVSLFMGLLLFLYGPWKVFCGSGRRMRNDGALGRYTLHAAVLVGGTLQGIAGLSGPIVAAALTRLNLPRSDIMFRLGVIFVMFGALQVPALLGLGILTPHLTGLVLLGVPLSFAGIWIGNRMGLKMRTALYEPLLTVFICLSGAATMLLNAGR